MSFFERAKSMTARTASFAVGTVGIAGVTLTLVLVRIFGGPSLKRYKRERSAGFAESLYQMELQSKAEREGTLEYCEN